MVLVGIVVADVGLLAFPQVTDLEGEVLDLKEQLTDLEAIRTDLEGHVQELSQQLDAAAADRADKAKALQVGIFLQSPLKLLGSGVSQCCRQMMRLLLGVNRCSYCTKELWLGRGATNMFAG